MQHRSVFLLIFFCFILIFGFQVSSNEFSGCKSKTNLLSNLLKVVQACLNDPDKCRDGNIVFQGVNVCNSNPCVHGNCSDSMVGYKCQCSNGYIGKNCNMIDPSMFKHVGRVNGKEYYKTKKTSSWNEARNKCQLLGGDLVTSGMRNQTTRETLKSLNAGEGFSHFWIGLVIFGSFKKHENNWYWIDGKKAIRNETNWDDGEPNNRGNKEEDCAEVWNEAFKFNDDDCMHEHVALCEIDRCRLL